jgi:hypothetical protein
VKKKRKWNGKMKRIVDDRLMTAWQVIHAASQQSVQA